MSKLRILALIPARGGSKRLPGKNIKLLGGLPLIAWTIKAALESKCCVDVLVSTDDQEIADISKSYGAMVPWLRPPELATDTAGSVDVALHALDAYEQTYGAVDGLMLLQPTSPFRSDDAIARAVKMFEAHQGKRSVVSISPAISHPAWTFQINGEEMTPYLGWDGIGTRSQDLAPAWTINGSIYLLAPNQLRQDKQFVTTSTLPFPMHQAQEALDIDTNTDFNYCQYVYSVSK